GIESAGVTSATAGNWEMVGIALPCSSCLGMRRDYAVTCEPLQTEIQRTPSWNTSTPVPAPTPSLGLRPLLAKAMAPAPGAEGSAATVYEGSTGGPENRGLTALLR